LFTAETASDDPVCGLNREEKLRVCTIVMSSSYFAGKITYLPDQNRLNDVCRLTKVAFQTNEARRDAKGNNHEEWILPCTVTAVEPNARNILYGVSRAYHSHYAVVYSRDRETGDWYIENISANIVVIVERPMEINEVKEKGRKLSPPNLVDHLRFVDEL